LLVCYLYLILNFEYEALMIKTFTLL